MDNKNIDEVIRKAVKKFGAHKQIAVAMEELCELASAVAKYIRYDEAEKAISDTREKVLDEYCDCIIVMHTIAIVYDFDYASTIAKGNEVLLGKKTIAMAMKNLCRLAEDAAYYLISPTGSENKVFPIMNTTEVKNSFVVASISIDNIRALYYLTDEEISTHLDAKIARVARWVNSEESSMEVTMNHRLVQDCNKCANKEDKQLCKTCKASEAVEGIKPFYKEG